MPLGCPPRARRGLVDADLGGGVIKQCIACKGGGRSGGFRTIVRDRRGELALCACGFAKSGRENLRRDALETFPLPASEHLALDPSGLAAELAKGAIVEATCDDRTVQERDARRRRPGRDVAIVLTSLRNDPASGNQSGKNGRSEPGKSPSGMFLELPDDETDHRAGPGGRPVKCQCCRERRCRLGEPERVRHFANPRESQPQSPGRTSRARTPARKRRSRAARQRGAPARPQREPQVNQLQLRGFPAPHLDAGKLERRVSRLQEVEGPSPVLH